MSDTRTIYLKNNEGTIYSSDPTTKGYKYLNMSDFDSLNPSDNSIFTSASNTSLLYSSYDVKLVLTFMSDYDNGRQARAEWIAKNQNAINQISVANTNNPDLIFSKQAKIKTIDFVENPYVNGVQAELTLELAGRWQSSVKRTRAIVYPYTGGTKKYTYHYSTLNRDLLVNRNLLLNTKALWTGGISNKGSKVVLTLEAFDSTTNMWHITAPQESGNAGIYFDQSSVSSSALTQGQSWAMSFDIKGTGVFSKFGMNSSDQWVNPTGNVPANWSRVSSTGVTGAPGGNGVGTNINIYFDTTNSPLDAYIKLPKLENGTMSTAWSPAPKDTNPKPTYKYGYQIITDEVNTDGYNGFIINIPSQTTPVNVTLTAPNGLSATVKTSQTNVPLQISSDMIGYSLDNFDTFTLLNKGFPASKYWDNLLSVYSTIQAILNFNTVTVSVTSGTGTSIPFEFYLYKLQDLI